MDRLTVSRSTAKKFLEKIKEKEYVPPVSFLFKSKNGYTGVDNSRHVLQVKEFSKKQECIEWLEESYSKRLRESEGFLPRLREWMTIRNLMDADIVSNITKGHAGIRYNLYKGENINAKLVKTVYNPTLDAMTFIFKTPATLKAHEPGYQPDIVDPYSNFATRHNPSHSYTMMIQVLDFLKWLKGTRPDNLGDITWQEIKAVLDVAYVKVWCNCLRGNTNIKLLDGRTLTVKEMAEEFKTNKDLWVYSVDEHGNFKPGKVTDVAETGKATEFVRITLDNGKYIETTPDHLYMLRDGSYKQACDLRIGESLMPLYFDEMLEYAGYKNFNHKVASIEYIQAEEESLYDISVDKWNNFYVDAGVILHNCMSFHWFGKNYRASQFDASLFPTNIPDTKMRAIYGEYDLLCKHLSNLMQPNSIQFFLPQMASASQKALRMQGLI